jgi:hypothetical protein
MADHILITEGLDSVFKKIEAAAIQNTPNE